MKSNQKPIWYPDDAVRYKLIPPLFVIFFTSIVQFLAVVGKNEEFSFTSAVEYSKGNEFSWKWTIFFALWSIASLKVSSKIVYGPETPFGWRPTYQDNGFQYYCVTLLSFLVCQFFYPELSYSLYDNFPQLLGTFNAVALGLCLVLLIKGKLYPDHKKDRLEKQPILYEFYRGVELHPRIFGIDVKQLTNCRIGMMGWQIYICAFFFASVKNDGFNFSSFASLALQTIYIAKFFWWESGYFYTLDMMLDRAGYYICWGCLVWIQVLYTWSSYYYVAHQPKTSASSASVILLVGVLSIVLNYRVDYEKQLFRNSVNYNCKIWGKKASYVLADYIDSHGKKKKSALLTSGFWGIGRHINYTFELSAAFCWCAAAGFDYSFWPFLYFVFLTGLLVHRTVRDEEKCERKYGKHWNTYCKKVPYRLIPFVW